MDDILNRGFNQIGDLDDPLILHLRDLLVFFHQLQTAALVSLKGTDLADQALNLGVCVVVGDAHLTEHHCPQVLFTHHYRNSNIHNAAVAEIDVGPVQPHRLQPGQRVALGAALAGYGIFPDHAAKLRPAAVLCYRRALVIYGDNGSSGSLGKSVLQMFKHGDVQYGFQIQILRSHFFSYPLVSH